MAQYLRGLPYQQEDLGLHPPNPYPKVAWGSMAVIPTLRYNQDRDRQIPEVHWPANPS